MYDFFRNLFQETCDLIRFYSNTKTLDKEVIFYSEHEGYYSYMEGLISELVKDISISYFTSDPEDPILSTENKRIKTFYFRVLLPFIMAFIDCKVLLMTMPDLDRFEIKKSKNDVHYIYIFHSLVSTTMMYRSGSFDHYDCIFCAGDYQIKEIRAYEKLRGLVQKELISTGYYRLERIYSKYQGYEKPEKSIKTILIAPSWGDENVIESCGIEITKTLLANGYKLIIRPHPETVKRNKQILDEYEEFFGSNPRFFLERSVSTDNSLLEADILISDCSGVALEYGFGTERPVIFMDVPLKIKNQNYEETGIIPLELQLRGIMGVIQSVDKIDELPGVIAALEAEKEDYKRKLSKLRVERISNFGDSPRIGAEYILDYIKKH